MKKNLILLFCLGVVLISCDKYQENIDIQWVYVKGGAFEQGKNQVVISKKGDTMRGFTSPHRMVQLDDFYISKYEITVAQFRRFCEQTGREMPKAPIRSAYGIDVHYQWEDNKPMLANWEEADAFAKWAGGRLPTEAEWEYAAKGGVKSKGYRYSGSNNATEIGWVAENSDSIFHDVGLLKPNELGIHDMTGNVNEWVSDWYNPSKDSLVSLTNPKGPENGVDNMKIAKGLSWFYDSQDENGKPLPNGIHLPEVRYQSPIDTRNDGFGFRIVKDL